MSKAAKIYIAGHRGMVGSSLWRTLENAGYQNLIGRSSKELDLRDQSAVRRFIRAEKPSVIINAAAKVGGILANQTQPFSFLIENLQIQNNLMESALDGGVNKFIFIGSSCIYPKFAPQPLKEESLLSGPLEPTNEAYAIAKIAGVKACEAIRKEFSRDFITIMPSNLYGPNDHFDLQTAHVLPALIRKFHEAKLLQHATVTLWGSGTALREFLHVDDLSKALLIALEKPLSDSIYNVGSGEELSIRELALLIQKTIGHTGAIQWDDSMPDGTPRKLLDSKKFKQLGWVPTIALSDGIAQTYKWFLNNQHHTR
ncbi:MAG: GDP-L-fucose synthase family protein [Flavobacteriales bacterium]